MLFQERLITHKKTGKNLVEMIKEGEHLQQDFKYEITDSKKIARTLSAFANTAGGRLLIGVKDNGEVRGISGDEEYYMILAASEMYTKPKVPFMVDYHRHKGMLVLEILVEKGKDMPYHAFDFNNRLRAYIRVKDQNFVAHTIQYQVWKNQANCNSVQINYSNEEDFLLKYLSDNETITLKQYINYAGLPRWKAVKNLTNMVLLNLVEIVHSDRDTYFVAVKQ